MVVSTRAPKHLVRNVCTRTLKRFPVLPRSLDDTSFAPIVIGRDQRNMV
jgi:hypothetical protein